MISQSGEVTLVYIYNTIVNKRKPSLKPDLSHINMSRLIFVFALSAVTFLKSADCKNWALLVAGSNTYDNYRHQADICHAYHVLRNHGFPAENIVTMMYDDIANNARNPYQGNIINQPNGPNVYPGVVIDYQEEDVNPDVFLAVLTGNKTGVKSLTGHEGRVIESGPNDHVFVNFADHGAPGLLAFPEDVLHARSLRRALRKMYKKKQYKKLVLYVEACESGSMFAGKMLSPHINIYAATAANPDQSSYACYYDDERETYLGDVFSVNWMQDSDKEDLRTETLQKQYVIVKKETNTSQVMEYGDLSITSMDVAEFQGDEASHVDVPLSPRHPTTDAVPAPEVAMKVLEHKYIAAKTSGERRHAIEAMSELMEHQAQIGVLFKDMVEWMQQVSWQQDQTGEDKVMRFKSELSYKDLVKERQPITQWQCYEEAVDELRNSCKGLGLSQNYHALKQLFVLVNLCERGFDKIDVRVAVLEGIKKNQKLCAVTTEN